MSLKDIRNCDYIVLLCNDMKETRAFYQDVLSFPVDHDSDNWVSFRAGATVPSRSW
jgi:catechol 2,3-dioxygenase-like lactoylglutathione lyase family enzyme